jgi:polyferredoxin
MTNLLIFILTSYGISNILVYSSVFEGLRTNLEKLGTGPKSLHKLFNCMMCMPTWVGFILSAVLQLAGVQTPFIGFGVEYFALAVFLDGVLASGSVYALNVLIEYLEGE